LSPYPARAIPPPLPKLASVVSPEAIDISAIRRLPGVPLRPSEVIRAFRDDLAPLELGEILKYPEVWHVGTLESKPERAISDSDYRDRKQHYLAYRYQVRRDFWSSGYTGVGQFFFYSDISSRYQRQ
jgi:hypothetical protein